MILLLSYIFHTHVIAQWRTCICCVWQHEIVYMGNFDKDKKIRTDKWKYNEEEKKIDGPEPKLILQNK